MTGDVITYLLGALCIVAFIQPNAPRLFAAVLFMAVVYAHELFLSNLDGIWYYGSAALFDLLIIVLTSGINPVPKMVLSLHKICMASVMANLFGWVIWYLYFPPLAYDLAFVGIYAWTLYVFIIRDRENVGGFAVDSWRACFRFGRTTWALYINKHKGEI